MEPNKLLRMVYEKSDEIDELWRAFLAVVTAGAVRGLVTRRVDDYWFLGGLKRNFKKEIAFNRSLYVCWVTTMILLKNFFYDLTKNSSR